MKRHHLSLTPIVTARPAQLRWFPALYLDSRHMPPDRANARAALPRGNTGQTPDG